MFNDASVRVERSVLYQQVWAEAMVNVAKKYSISDVALAKICRKLNIPVPGRGYWRRKHTGKRVPPQPPLPSLPSGAPTAATIRSPLPKPTSEPASAAVQKQVAYEAEHPIEVPDRISRVHPLLTDLSSALKTASADHYGALMSCEAKQFNLRVSKETARRAVRILHAFITATFQRGFTPAAGSDKKTFSVTVLGESLEIALEERFKQVPHVPTRQPSATPWYTPRFDYESTGQLSLRIKSIWGGEVRKVWRDTKTARLEEVLNDVMVGLVKAAEAQRIATLERDRQRQEWEAERKRKELEEQRRQEELARRQALEAESAKWAKAIEIRGYVAALRTAAEQQSIPSGDDRLTSWLAWAAEHADRLDPVPRLLSILAQPATTSAEEASDFIQEEMETEW